MTPEEIGRRLLEDCNEFDGVKFYNHYGKQKRRFLERNDERIRRTKISKEASKTVALRLQKKLIERGGTPNLNAKFFVEPYLKLDFVTPGSY